MVSSVSSFIKESLPVLLLCVLGGVAAGLVLDSIVIEFAKIPGLVVVVPALLGMRGNISGVLSSRIASALHLGLIVPELKWNKTLRTNIYSALFLNVLMSLILGVVAYYTYFLIGKEPVASIVQLVLITLLSGSIAGFLLTFLAVGLALYTYASGYDPDNVVLPLMATVGDLITVLCLLGVTKIII